jgi:hypothetical protein
MNEDGLLDIFYKGENLSEKLEFEKNIKNLRYNNIAIE